MPEEYPASNEKERKSSRNGEGIGDLPHGSGFRDLTEAGVRAREGVMSFRAEEWPFPWWEPFDAADAFGRTFVLLGLACLAVIFALILNFEELVYVSYSGRIRTDELLGLISAVAIILCVAGFFAAMGAGLLLRRQWAVVMFRSLLVIAAIPTVFFSIFLLLVALFSPLLRMGLAGSIFALAGFFVLLIIFFFLIGPLWRFWSAWHVKYGFGYVPVQSLRGGLYDTTRRFGQSIARLGLAFIICAAVADFGMWESMQPSYGYGDSSGIIGIMNYQSLIRRIVLFCAAVLLPILIAATRYRTSLLLIGLAAMITILTANILVLLYSFQDISYNYFYSYRATYPPYMFWPMLSTLLLIYFLGLFGFWMVAAGIGFARNENPARRAMQAVALSMIGMMVISAVLVFAFIASESRGRVFRFVDLKLVVVIVVALFFLVPPGYLFFELFRYFGSGKAKAWCNAGEYTPPWRVQVDAIKALVEDEGGEGIQPER